MTALDGKVILLTGATDGMGRALAADLGREGATVLVHGRDKDRIAATVAEVAAAAGSQGLVRSYQADLASLAAVRGLADQVTEAEPRLDVLVNNAGIGINEPGGGARQESADGLELRFAVNYLAGYALSRYLLPLLTRSAPARIVNVASLGQHAIDFDDIMITRGYSGSRAYGQSKLAQIMSGFELASRVPAAEVTVNSLHPATYMPTKMVLLEVGRQVDTMETGVTATRRLVSDPALAGVTGRFYDRTREAKASPQAYDGAARAALWQRSLELTGHPGLA